MNLLSRRAPKKNLIYTVVFDAPGSESYRFLGKMLASSLVRTFFTGDVLVFRNSPVPLFLVERKGLEEVYLETPEMYGQERAEFSWCYKYRAAELIDPEPYDKIMFVDADCLALRNIDHLLEGDWDIRYQPERGQPMSDRKFNAFLTEEDIAVASTRDGANSGTLAVRGKVFHQVMETWRDIDEGEPVRDSGFRDQASWNATLLRGSSLGAPPSAGAPAARAALPETGLAGVEAGVGLAREEGPHGDGGGPRLWKTEAFPAGEVQFPGYLDPHYASYSKAALTHNIMADTKEKVEFTFGLYMRTFFCDPTGLFFSMLEM